MTKEVEGKPSTSFVVRQARRVKRRRKPPGDLGDTNPHLNGNHVAATNRMQGARVVAHPRGHAGGAAHVGSRRHRTDASAGAARTLKAGGRDIGRSRNHALRPVRSRYEITSYSLTTA